MAQAPVPQEAQQAAVEAAELLGIALPPWLASGGFWMGWVEAALAAYASVSVLKRLISRFPPIARHVASDHGARLAAVAFGAVWAVILVPAPEIQIQLAAGAVAGAFAVPIYHAVKRSGALMGGRWALVESIANGLNGPGVGPARDSRSRLPAEAGNEWGSPPGAGSDKPPPAA